jgi:hypothetical protein
MITVDSPVITYAKPTGLGVVTIEQKCDAACANSVYYGSLSLIFK